MTNDVVAHGISRIWTVKHSNNSSIHKAGMVLNPREYQENDPFLFLQEDWFQKGVFELHPHRGQETVTFVIEGHLEHYDNNFGTGTLGPGDVQWMTAGGGVIHKEDAAESETIHSLQLWINLPKSKKMTEPRYQNLLAKEMPVRHEDGARIRIFSGSSAGITASTLNHVPVTMVEMVLEPGAMVTQDLPGSYNGFLYVLEGSGTFGKDDLVGTKNQVLRLDSASGASHSNITVCAKEKLRVLLYAGEPVNEPVVQYGPFVMNSEDEIRQAIYDYQNGKFAPKT